jgi:hypothetical protein
MPDFIDILPEFRFNPSLTSDNWTGTLVYRQADNPSASMTPNVIDESLLPSPGDTFPAQAGWVFPPNFIARDFNIVYEGGDMSKNKKYTINYATKDTTRENSPSDEDVTESLSISSQAQELDLRNAPNAVKVAFKLDNDPIPVLTVRHIVASYTINQPGYGTLALAAASGPSPGVVDIANRNWLMLGTSVQQYRDDSGATAYRASRSYSYRKIRGPKDKVNGNDNWQCNFSETKGQWFLTDPLNYEEAANPDTMPVIP